MFELLRAWQASLSDPERFRLRAKVLVLEGVHVDRPEERIRWTGFWNRIVEKTDEEIRGLQQQGGRPDQVTPELERLKLLREIADNVNHLLGFVKDTLRAETFDGYVKWVESIKSDHSVVRTDDGVASWEGRNRIIRDLEERINKNSQLAPFIGDVGLGSANAGRFSIGHEVRIGTASIRSILAGIEARIDASTDFKDSARKELKVIVGGIAALGFDASWLAAQAEKLPGGKPINIPAYGHGYYSDPSDDGLRYDLIAFASSAIAESHVILEDVLVRMEPDVGRRGPPKVLRGVIKKDSDFEWKLHFIDRLLRDASLERTDDERPSASKSQADADLVYAKRMEDYFETVKEQMEEKWGAGRPYAFKDSEYHAHVGRLRDGLGLSKMLFYAPNQGDFKTIYREHVRVLLALKRMHDKLTPSK